MAAQVWVPQDAAVQQICTLLADFQSPTADQAQVRRGGAGGTGTTRCASPHARAGSRAAWLRLLARAQRRAPTFRRLKSIPPPHLNVRPQVFQKLEQARHVPDFNNYLSYVYSKGDTLPSEVRPQRAPAPQHPSKRPAAALAAAAAAPADGCPDKYAGGGRWQH